MRKFLFYVLIALHSGITGCSTNEQKSEPKNAYEVVSITLPDGLSAENGGIDFLPDGRLAACFLRGEVMIYDPAKKTWSVFAEGLQEPLGIMAVSDSEFLVMQRPELTRIKDTNGDGKADIYETVVDDFGISGNYHEFNYGPVKDKDGNLFIALNAASSGGSILKELRGQPDTVSGEHPHQMFSPVPYRGWIMKLTKDGKLAPFATGFRSPNGIGFDLKGNLFATDNQGDWVGSSPLYHVVKDRFYGHPAGLVWTQNWSGGDPFKLPVAELEKMRTRPTVIFPHDIIANSPTQPVCDGTNGKFGPFGGQLLVGEMNSERIVRVMLDEVDGELQGACIPFIDGRGLHKGNNRLAFAPDGSLWVGQAEHGWAGGSGIQRIVFTGKQPMDVYSMKLNSKGFDLEFTKPLDQDSAANKANYRFRRYYYEYHAKYGSDQMDVQEVKITGLEVSSNHKKVSIALSSLMPGYVYELTLGNIRGADGEKLDNQKICYTLNRLRK